MKKSKVIMIVGLLLVVLLSVFYYQSIDHDEKGIVFNSMDEFKNYYESIEIIEFETQNYGFCKLQEGQILADESGSLVMKIVERDNKIILEPVDESVMPKLIETYFENKFK